MVDGVGLWWKVLDKVLIGVNRGRWDRDVVGSGR